MPAFTLYGSPGSTNTDVIRLTLAEGASTDYDTVSVDLFNGEQKSGEHLKRNPWGKVPVITFPDGFTLYESAAICKYLATKYSFQLLPPRSDAKAVALFDQAQSAEVLYFFGPPGQISFELVAKKFMGLSTDEAVVANALRSLESYFDVVEQLLQQHNYMAGVKFTLVDIYHIPMIQRLSACGYGDLVSSCKAVSAWWERCTTRPAIQKMLAAERKAMEAAAAAKHG